MEKINVYHVPGSGLYDTPRVVEDLDSDAATVADKTDWEDAALDKIELLAEKMPTTSAFEHRKDDRTLKEMLDKTIPWNEIDVFLADIATQLVWIDEAKRYFYRVPGGIPNGRCDRNPESLRYDVTVQIGELSVSVQWRKILAIEALRSKLRIKRCPDPAIAYLYYAARERHFCKWLRSEKEHAAAEAVRRIGYDRIVDADLEVHKITAKEAADRILGRSRQSPIIHSEGRMPPTLEARAEGRT